MMNGIDVSGEHHHRQAWDPMSDRNRRFATLMKSFQALNKLEQHFSFPARIRNFGSEKNSH